MAKRTENIEIGGMTCGHCQSAVTREIKEIEGVESVEVLMYPGQAKVVFDDAKTSREAIVAAVNETGSYTAK